MATTTTTEEELSHRRAGSVTGIISIGDMAGFAWVRPRLVEYLRVLGVTEEELDVATTICGPGPI